MSYNGIGLQTPRGSGTSGYVQKNLTGPKTEGLRQKRQREAREDQIRQTKTQKRLIRKSAGGDIIAHNKKRVIEVKCMELRDELEDQGLDEDVVEKRVAELREKLTKKDEKDDINTADETNTDGKEQKKEEKEEEEEEEENVDGLKANEKESATDKPDTKLYSYVPRYSER